MKWVLGVPLLSLMLAAHSTQFDDPQWTTTEILSSLSSLATLSTTYRDTVSSIRSTATTALSAALSSASVSVTDAPAAAAAAAAAGETSPRLPDATDDESPDYYDDETYEAASGDGGPRSATDQTPIPEGVTDDETPDYYDDETYEAASVDGPRPESDNAPIPEGACSVERQGRDCDASRGKNTAPSGSTTAMSRREELEAAPAEPDTCPEPINWISWLPSWCRHWPLYGPLGVPRETQLQAFSEALEEHTIGVDRYWSQPAQSADDDEQLSTEGPQTHLISVAMQQSELLQEFYLWIYDQLTSSEAAGDCTPESLDRFLDALEHQANMAESVCRSSPTIRLTCNACNVSLYRNFIWAMDRHAIWMHIFTNWAVSQYNLGAGPQRHPRWWLPANLLDENIPSFNVSNLSIKDQTEGDSTSGVEAVGNGVCSVEEVRAERERMVCDANFDMSSEATAKQKSYPIQRQLEPREKPHNQDRKFPTCVLQSLSTRSHEPGQLPGAERTQMRDTGTALEEDVDQFEAASAPPNNGPDPDDAHEVNPNESFYGGRPQHVLQLRERTGSSAVQEGGQEQEQDGAQQQMVPESNFPACSETPVVHVLGSDFDPYFLVYVTCNERDRACEPPEVCQPMNTVVTVVMPRWATIPEFPHTFLSAQELPTGRLSALLLVPTSCACIEPLAEN